MIKRIKQLFCRHSWSDPYEIQELVFLDLEVHFFKCDKCGKGYGKLLHAGIDLETSKTARQQCKAAIEMAQQQSQSQEFISLMDKLKKLFIG